MELTHSSKPSSSSSSSTTTSSSSGKEDDQELEALDQLLDAYWFFDNLLRRRKGMPRSSSDPFPSSNNIINKVDVDEKYSNEQLSISKSPSRKQGGTRARRISLLRTPSLPPCIGRGATAQEKICPRSNKLTRQASLCSSDVLPPLNSSKVQKHTSIPRNQAKAEDGMSNNIADRRSRGILTREAIYRSLIADYKKSSKSLSELEFEEVQGFKDLGFIFSEEDLNPSVISIIPGLQVKKQIDRNEDKVKRPYLSEAWLVSRSSPRIPEPFDPRSMDDMKAQLKFWARTVAFNMRQEC